MFELKVSCKILLIRNNLILKNNSKEGLNFDKKHVIIGIMYNTD